MGRARLDAFLPFVVSFVNPFTKFFTSLRTNSRSIIREIPLLVGTAESPPSRCRPPLKEPNSNPGRDAKGAGSSVHVSALSGISAVEAVSFRPASSKNCYCHDRPSLCVTAGRFSQRSPTFPSKVPPLTFINFSP